jgi:mRNA-degrading endonuclease RelE of RelBE toxin-antitoxin system
VPTTRRFALSFAPEVVQDLQAIDRKYHSLIRRRVNQLLTYEPGRATRNRKPLDVPAPYGAQWEARFGPGNRFRVFYEIDSEAGEVMVLAIGVKDRNVLRIGREEYHP